MSIFISPRSNYPTPEPSPQPLPSSPPGRRSSGPGVTALVALIAVAVVVAAGYFGVRALRGTVAESDNRVERLASAAPVESGWTTFSVTSIKVGTSSVAVTLEADNTNYVKAIHIANCCELSETPTGHQRHGYLVSGGEFPDDQINPIPSGGKSTGTVFFEGALDASTTSVVLSLQLNSLPLTNVRIEAQLKPNA